MSAFYDYLRGITDQPPEGYTPRGLAVYKHLVYLGVDQLLRAEFPSMPETLGEAQWRELLEKFIQQSRWESPFYADLSEEFLHFLRDAASGLHD
jgi:hypothetical protein